MRVWTYGLTYLAYKPEKEERKRKRTENCRNQTGNKSQEASCLPMFSKLTKTDILGGMAVTRVKYPRKVRLASEKENVLYAISPVNKFPYRNSKAFFWFSWATASKARFYTTVKTHLCTRVEGPVNHKKTPGHLQKWKCFRFRKATVTSYFL